AQVPDLDAKVVDGPAASIPGSLVVDVETPGPDGEKHAPRASQFVVEEQLGAHMPAPPFDRRIDIARKQMNVVEIQRHGSLSGELDGGVTALPHVGSTATSSGVARTGWLQFDEALEANDRTTASDPISAETRRFRDSSRLRIITSRASSAR